MDVQQQFQKALAFHQSGDLVTAEKSYRKILRSTPHHFDATYLLGLILLTKGQFEMAEKQFLRAVKINSNVPHAFNDLANAQLELKRPSEALRNYDKAIALNANFAEAFNNRGNALIILQRSDEAIASYDKAIAIKPDYAKAFYNRGNLLRRLKKHEAALASYQQAIVINPNYVEAHNNRGNLLLDLHQPEAALVAYDKAISLNPSFAEAFANRTNALIELRRLNEAFVACETALALSPDLPEAWLARGDVLRNLRRHNESLTAYDQALKLNPLLADAWSARAKSLHALQRHEDAVEAYVHLHQIAPDYNFVKGHMAYEKMLACDWNGLAEIAISIRDDIRAGKKSAQPFGYQALSNSAKDLKRCAEIFIEEEHPAQAPLCREVRYHHEKIRIGYVSGEFRQHATSILVGGLFGLHDKNHFEIFAFDNGYDDGSEIRRRINASVDHMVDISRLSDAQAAFEIKRSEIDILVNLNGFFGEARNGIFSHRPAPVQVNYLGFPGTMGTSYIDYIIADQWVIPPDQEDCYVEKIAYLPETYQVNDVKRRIAEDELARTQAMLPETGFVFCCFNNNYKITPEIFDIWMRVLGQVHGSVLWLIEDNVDAANNLRREAIRRGIQSERLVFATRVNLPEHLARHRLADLFVDTLPYNAHTTASDALWAGVPVLTCLGSTFPGRVAASLLHAVGMPELIAHSLEDYESLAIRLAQDAKLLAVFKAKLATNRGTSPLFNTQRFTRHLEAAYTTMWQRHQSGQPPSRFVIAPID